MNEPPDDQDREQSTQPTKRKAGRPRKWQGGRRIDPIYEGRMSFQPGDKHPMDAQLEQARMLGEAITEQLAQVQGLVIELAQFEDAGEAISREEQAIKALLWKLYGNRKHRDHILATFIAARRRRLLQRLQAAGAALEQVRQFLTADSVMLPLLQKTLAEAEAHTIALHGPPPPVPGAEGTDTQDQAEEEDEHRALLHIAGGGDDAATTRAALQAFEARARVMRNAIAEGRGSFEWYYIPKPRKRTPEAAEQLARGEPIPPEVQEYEDGDPGAWGPYLRYRWWEGAERYSIGMGHIRRRDLQRPDEPPEL
jgi:hypothetical protein